MIRRMSPTSICGTACALVLCIGLGAGGCRGCAESPPEDRAKPHLPSTGAYEFSTAGERDKENRYSSTVMVSTKSAASVDHKECSGVIIAPRLVLTAGHCVCARREAADGGAVVDGSRCTPEATVLTFVYGASGKSSRTVSEEYYGQVRPHPDLKLILDAQEAVVSSKADLALVSLDEPVEGGFPPMALAQEREEANTPSSLSVMAMMA
jgi:hypothetical protein